MKRPTQVSFRGSVALINVVNLLSAPENYQSLKMAVNAATDVGVHIAIPAGNDNVDACVNLFADSNALIVGASTLGDERAYFSNYGPTC